MQCCSTPLLFCLRTALPDLLMSAISVLCIGASLTEGVTSYCTPLAPYSAYLCELLESAFPGRKITVANKGIRGETSVDVKRRLAAICTNSHSFDYVAIWCGTNDIGMEPHTHPVVVAEQIAEMCEIVMNTSSNSSTCPILLSIPSFGKAALPFLEDDWDFRAREWLCSALPRIAAHYNGLFVDVYNATSEEVEIANIFRSAELGVASSSSRISSRVAALGRKEIVLSEDLPRKPRARSLVNQFNGDGLHMTAVGYRAVAELVAEAIRTSENS